MIQCINILFHKHLLNTIIKFYCMKVLKQLSSAAGKLNFEDEPYYCQAQFQLVIASAIGLS